MGDISYSTRPRGQRIPQSVRDDMERRLRAGEIVADIARKCGVSTYAAIKLARDLGIEYTRCLPGANFGKGAKSRNMRPVMSYEQQVRGWMHSLRWGDGHGS